MSETTTTPYVVQPDEPGSLATPWFTRFGEPIYGRVPTHVRAEWDATMMCQQPGPMKAEVDRNHTAAYAYAMGWYDATKKGHSPAWCDAVMALAWHFGTEFAYATYRMTTGEVSSRYGYANAWEKAVATLPADLT